MNLSERVFTEIETRVLERGLCFALTPRHVSVIDFAASIQMSLHVGNALDRA